jgi:glucoamylase
MRAVVVVLASVLATSSFAAPAHAAPPVSGPAPGAPGLSEGFLPADKSGFATATSTRSPVWLTVRREGGLGELFYPDLGTPAARALQFVVAPDAASTATVSTSGDGLTFRQTSDRPGRWRLTTTFVTDPERATVLVDVEFSVFDGRRRDLYAIYDPALSNTPDDDRGRTAGPALLAEDGKAASALVAEPAFTATANGFRGVSDGWTDLRDGRLDWRYTETAAGNLVQTAVLGLRGRRATLALGFGAAPADALGTARAALRRGFDATARDYAHGWRTYLTGLKPPPVHASAGPDATPPGRPSQGADRRLYEMSMMMLAAHEDKAHRGAYVASPTMPWVWGRERPSGPYHLVWSRDLYQVATALLVAGDTAGANRALTYLFDVQQRPDGSFPQNSHVDGTPVWTGLQLDEVALPIVLAYQLGRTDAAAWAHVRRAADFIVGFEQDGNRAPWTPQERWENQSGYSPATIASEIAALVCAASIARLNGDPAAADRYLAVADDWQARVKGWTVTTTGPYSSGPYFLRLTKDGNPNAGTTYDIGDSGPSNVDQRRVVDPSFLELVRLGVLPADDPAVVNTLRVIDAQLGVRTPRGMFWHRASFDGYGEKANGDPWEFGLPADSFITRGRAWPLLNGERGEYELAAGSPWAARRQLATIAASAGPGLMLPEQVWDEQAPPGFRPGTPTFSATPLAWTHAQYVRLARDLAAGRLLDQPDVVAARYLPLSSR